MKVLTIGKINKNVDKAVVAKAEAAADDPAVVMFIFWPRLQCLPIVQMK